MRTATPQLTCWRITARGPSATCGETSTPRLIGPGCMTIASGFAYASVRSDRPNVRDSSRVFGNRGASPSNRSCWTRSIITTSAPSRPSSRRGHTRTRSRVRSPPISSMPRGRSVHGATTRTRAPSFERHRMFERATRECEMSPTIATSSPSRLPLWRRIVAASSSACVGCSCWPSPALIDGALRGAREHRGGATERVAHHDRIGVHRFEISAGIEQRLALGRR